ncbi:hypothetical protein QL285_089094 [Trifolium repens]|jgi:hypothetical protein|nr:hypothetical protein QL285_089094 [Trifolium repens]
MDAYASHRIGSLLSIQNKNKKNNSNKLKIIDKLTNHKDPNYLRVKDGGIGFPLLESWIQLDRATRFHLIAVGSIHFIGLIGSSQTCNRDFVHVL